MYHSRSLNEYNPKPVHVLFFVYARTGFIFLSVFSPPNLPNRLTQLFYYEYCDRPVKVAAGFFTRVHKTSTPPKYLFIHVSTQSNVLTSHRVGVLLSPANKIVNQMKVVVGGFVLAYKTNKTQRLYFLQQFHRGGSFDIALASFALNDQVYASNIRRVEEISGDVAREREARLREKKVVRDGRGVRVAPHG